MRTASIFGALCPLAALALAITPAPKPRAEFLLGSFSGQRLAFTRASGAMEVSGPGHHISITPAEITITNLEGFGSAEHWNVRETTRVRFPGARPALENADFDALDSLRLRGVWSGVDAIYSGAAKRLELRLLAAPDAQLSPIALEFDGIYRLRVEKDGAARVSTSLGQLRIPAPERADAFGGEPAPIPGAWVKNRNRLRFVAR